MELFKFSCTHALMHSRTHILVYSYTHIQNFLMKMLMGRGGWARETMLSGRIEGVAEYWPKEMTRGSGKGSDQEDIPEYFFGIQRIFLPLNIEI